MIEHICDNCQTKKGVTRYTLTLTASPDPNPQYNVGWGVYGTSMHIPQPHILNIKDLCPTCFNAYHATIKEVLW
jgi:hypothetical protein